MKNIVKFLLGTTTEQVTDCTENLTSSLFLITKGDPDFTCNQKLK